MVQMDMFNTTDYSVEYLYCSFAGSFYEPARIIADHGDTVTIEYIDPFLESPVKVTTDKDRIRF